MKDKNPDAFIGITYPPDTILASRQAREVGFNPKFFYASVGTAFQLYKNVMRGRRRGRDRHGLVERQDQPRGQGLLRRAHEEVRQGARPLGQRPLLGRAARSCSRRWPRSGWTARRCATTSRRTSSSTIIGPIRFNGSENTSMPGTVASGRTASSRWCGRRNARPRHRSCRSRRGADEPAEFSTASAEASRPGPRCAGSQQVRHGFHAPYRLGQLLDRNRLAETESLQEFASQIDQVAVLVTAFRRLRRPPRGPGCAPSRRSRRPATPCRRRNRSGVRSCGPP